MFTGQRVTVILASLVIAIAGVAGMLALTGGGGNQTGQTALAQERDQDRGVSVNGQGQVSVQPDTAKVVLGVEIDGQDIGALREEANTRMDDIIAALQEQGIDENDIRTVAYDIVTREDEMPPEPREPEPDAETSTSEGAGTSGSSGSDSGTAAEPAQTDQAGEDDDGDTRITGYRITQLIEVTVRDIDATGDVVDTGLDAGANSVRGIRFEVEDREGAIQQARELAVEDARAKADHLAELTGVSLGTPLYVDERSPSGPPVAFEQEAAEADGAVGAAAPIQPGESTITVNVNIVYAIE